MKEQRYLSRQQASEYLSQHLKEKNAQQWHHWLVRNIRQSKHVYKLSFKEKGKQICYSVSSLLAFIKSSTTLYHQMNKGVQHGR